MPFEYQKHNRYLARAAEGLREAAAKELAAAGARDLKDGHRGLYFGADAATLYRVNLTSRLCTRIIAPLLTFDCHSTKYLYRTACKLPWHEFLRPQESFMVNALTANSKIRHSQYAALCLKDAVVDHCRDHYGRRPNVDRRRPDLVIDLSLVNNRAMIGIDTSGGSLHRRGYRRQGVAAPMQETLAAAIIEAAGWDGERPLVDPMCGSGTLLSEAHMRYCRVPAGILRQHYGFFALPDFDPELWREVRLKAVADQRPLPAGLISGSDIDPAAVTAARTNLAVIADGATIDIECRDFRKIPALHDRVIVCNPPYGVRLKDTKGAAELVTAFGDFLKRRCTGSTCYLYLGKKELLKKVGLRPSWKRPLKNGGLDGVLACYELY